MLLKRQKKEILPRCLLASIALLFLSVPPAHAAYMDVISADSPIHWWRFEDASSSNGDTATDFAGNGDGTYNGDIVFGGGIMGMTGQSATLDGNLDSVSMGNLGALPTQGSIEFWVFPDSTTFSGGPFTTGELDLLTGSAAIRFHADQFGKLQTHIGDDGSSSPDFSATIENSVTDSTWHHVVLTWNTTTSSVSAFYDGNSIFTQSNSEFPSTMTDVRIGLADVGTINNSWQGEIDEVAIYDYQLSANQVSNHFAAIVPLPPAVLLFLSGLAALAFLGRKRPH